MRGSYVVPSDTDRREKRAWCKQRQLRARLPEWPAPSDRTSKTAVALRVTGEVGPSECVLPSKVFTAYRHPAQCLLQETTLWLHLAGLFNCGQMCRRRTALPASEWINKSPRTGGPAGSGPANALSLMA